MEYKEQIVCFIDILGFSELIKKAQEDDNFAIETIKNLSSNIQEKVIKNIDPKIEWNDDEGSDLQYRIFSDCICISYDISKFDADIKSKMIYFFLQTILYIQSDLVKEDIFIRGAISIDKHFQNEDIIFSAALVNAYNSESKNAIYPRIVLEESVIQYIKHYEDEQSITYFNTFIKRDPDNIIFMDYLSYTVQLGLEEEHENNFELHKIILENRLKLETEPKVLQKYLWVANYHNYKVKEYELNSKYKIEQNLISFSKEVFTIKTYAFEFKSKKEKIKAGIIIVHTDNRWLAIELISNYKKSKKLDYEIDIEDNIRVFEKELTEENVKESLEGDENITLDKIFAIKDLRQVRCQK